MNSFSQSLGLRNETFANKKKFFYQFKLIEIELSIQISKQLFFPYFVGLVKKKYRKG